MSCLSKEDTYEKRKLDLCSANPLKVVDELPLGTKKEAVSVQDRTTALLRGLRMVLRHHGCAGILIDLMNCQMRRYLDNSESEKVWLKRAKHALTYPLSKYLRNDPPEAPDRVFEPAGSFRRWWKSRLNAFNRKNTHLWYSWLQGKRCTLPAGVDMIEKTYQDHLAMLTSADDGKDETIEAIFQDPTFQHVIKKLKYQVSNELENSDLFTEFTPSGSACFERSRREFGQFGEIRDVVEDGEDEFFATDELVSMDEVSYRSNSQKHHRGPVVVESRRCAGYDSWIDLHEREREFDTSRRLKCIIQGILEPMKVRVISKGESIPYYSMKPVQKVIHGILRRWDCFRLIGRPFLTTDMVDLKEKSKTDYEWFSIDYSAATDGLSYKYSGAILEEILEFIPPHMYRRAMQVLGMHDLYYPDKHEVYGYERVTSCTMLGTMSRGQLMGSILSFPILCLANLGLYLLVTQEMQKGWTHKERLRHVLINGDDMLYAAPVELWNRHVALGRDVGLTMSVGKAYHHPIYANVNSTSVHYRLDKPDDLPYQIDFLNTGLFFGMHKVQQRVDGEAAENSANEQKLAEFFPDHLLNDRTRYLLKHVPHNPGIIGSIGDTLKGSLPKQVNRLLTEYLELHSEEIERASLSLVKYDRHGRMKLSLVKRNLFIPEAFGGLGVRQPVGFKSRKTSFDKKIARWLASRAGRESFITFQLPLPGHPVPDMTVTAPWVRPLCSEVGKTLDARCGEISFSKVGKMIGLYAYLPVLGSAQESQFESDSLSMIRALPFSGIEW
jgi:hypothetical protein